MRWIFLLTATLFYAVGFTFADWWTLAGATAALAASVWLFTEGPPAPQAPGPPT